MHARHAQRMAALQLRDVPDDLHRELKVRAARSGQSLSEYTLAVLQQHVATPTLPELMERISRRAAVEPEIPVGELIRAERDARSE